MATTRDIITRALRRLRVVAITEEVPAEHMVHALSAFNAMLGEYEADNLLTETVIITGSTSNGSRSVTNLNVATNLYNASSLVVGMDVSGTGLSGRIHEIVSDDAVKLDTAATATGEGITITFQALPMDDSMESSLVAVLAVRMAEDYGAQVGPILARDARRGQSRIDGIFLKVPMSDGVDSALVKISKSDLRSGVSINDG